MMKRSYQWRLHPPPTPNARRPPPTPPDQHQRVVNNNNKEIFHNKTVSNTKYSFKLNDNVYIRPKSAKEFGVSGRIVEIITSSDDNTRANAKKDNGCCNKRRRVEDVRVSIQPHCFFNDDSRSRVAQNCSFIKRGVRPSRLFPVYNINNDDDISNGSGSSSAAPQTQILITADTTNYRQLATSHILRASDKILEIGCSTGECTALVLRRLLLLHNNKLHCNSQKEQNTSFEGRIVAFDTGPEILEQAKQRVQSEFNNFFTDQQQQQSTNKDESITCAEMVQFYKVDAIADSKGAYSLATKINGNSNNNINNNYNQSRRTPDVILIDIGGNRELKGIASMIQWVQSVFDDDDGDPAGIRLVIVKSEALVEELSKSTATKSTKESTDRTQPAVMDDGIIDHGQEWFTSLLSSSYTKNNTDNDDDVVCKQQCSSAKTMVVKHQQQLKPAPSYAHPLRAPLVLSPRDMRTPICRFHNYHPDGCKRSECQYDHEHCHWCLKAGHVALNCNLHT